jgi:hypothetical protein
MEVGFDAREIKGGFMKIDPQSPDLPISWQLKPNYSFRVDWLTKTKSEQAEKRNAEMLKQEALESGEVPEDLPKGGVTQQHPGWYMHLNVDMSFADSLEEALADARKFIKNSDFSASAFGRMGFEDQTKNFNAPVKPFKAQRLELIRQLETPKEHVGKFDFFREAFVEIGEYALTVGLESLSMRDEIETVFFEAENPVRSMIGLECAVSKGKDEDWEDVATGELELEGNTVRVGTWSRDFEDHDEVSGIAFGEASVYDAIQDIVYFFDIPDKSISDGDD